MTNLLLHEMGAHCAAMAARSEWRWAVVDGLRRRIRVTLQLSPCAPVTWMGGAY